MMWLPEHGVGAVILTNGDPGWPIRDEFKRKLLEVLFDGRPQAEVEVATAAATYSERIAATRKLLDVPVDADLAAELAPAYDNAALGELAVRRGKGKVVFDFGEWKSEVASRKNPDGTVSMVTISPGVSPGFDWIEFVVGNAAGKRTLTVRDYQHEYVFAASSPGGRDTVAFVDSEELRARVATGIRELAAKRNLQNIELSYRADVSRAHLFAVLAGRKSPTLDYLNRLATALDCDPHELVKPPRKPAAKR